MNFSIAALVAMGAVTAGCAKVENIETPENQEPLEILENDNIVTLTTTVGFAETKALAIDYGAETLTKTFAPGDQIGIFYKDTRDWTLHTLSDPLTEDDITNNGKSGKFTFSLSNPKAGGEFRYIYPAPFVNLELGNRVDVYNYATICYYKPLQSQDGTLATLASTLDLAVFDGRFTEPSISVTLLVLKLLRFNSFNDEHP